MAENLPFYKPAPFMYTSVAQRGWSDPTDILRWNPGGGYFSTALDMKNEPLRTYSVYGVKGSRKFPMGKAFPEMFELDNWDDFINYKSIAIGIIVSIIILKLIFSSKSIH